MQATIICLLALLPTSGDAYALPATQHQRVDARPALAVCAAPRVAQFTAQDAGAIAADDNEPSKKPLAGGRAWFGKWAKFDKASLQTLGVDAFFTYGVVSNLNVAVTAALAWGAFSKASGLSPLAPGQFKGYTAAYAAIYLSLGTILRPVRMAVAVSLTPVYSAAVTRLRERLPFYENRPKLNRTMALFLISLLCNVVGTAAFAFAGAWIASLVTGVPMFPPGYFAS